MLVGLALGVSTSCEEPALRAQVDRSHRFGIFRDLVLFQRPPAEGGAFFLDRFESTIADFAAWDAARGREPDRAARTDHHPQTQIDLDEARRFAGWRFCRVPRAAEWTYACTQGGIYKFPWGNTWRATWANTRKLGLGETTPVGSFESGRGPDGPYDMVGNVAEWTETVLVWDAIGGSGPSGFTKQYRRKILLEEVVGLYEWPELQLPVPPRTVDTGDDVVVWPREQTGAMPLGLRLWLPGWCPLPAPWLESGQFRFNYDPARDQFTHEVEQVVVQVDLPGVESYRGTPGLNWWLPRWSPAPTDWLVMAESDDLKRQILGGTCRSVVSRAGAAEFPLPRRWLPGQWDSTTGVRVAADPEGLLVALLSYHGEPGVVAGETLRRFLGRTEHHEVLAAAWPGAARRAPPGGSLRGLLTSLLGGG